MLEEIGNDWLRGLDLNQRPLGYEPKGSTLSPVDSVALTRIPAQMFLKNVRFLHGSCT
jgi:hypothetical protein